MFHLTLTDGSLLQRKVRAETQKGNNLKAGAEAGIMKKFLLTDLFLIVCSVCLFYTDIQSHIQGDSDPLGWETIHRLLIKEMPYRVAFKQSGWRRCFK